MQQQTSIYIPKPCHEDWNKMTATQQGKFCSACSKHVIDFSLMSDNQILNVISNQQGKLCGRFDAEQLQRQLIETKIKKKKSWWMALTMPLLFLFDRSEAQENIPKQNIKGKPVLKQNEIVGDTIYTVSDTVQYTGLVAKRILNNKMIIKGKVVDENNNPLAFASVSQKGFIGGTTTDSAGNFSINIQPSEDNILKISYIGFTSLEQKIDLKNDDNIIIVLKQQLMGLQDVIVKSDLHICQLSGFAGGLVVTRKISRINKLDTTFKMFTGVSNVFPNPAPKGSSINIKIKNTGSYQMQLLDNQSHLIQSEEITVDAKNITTQIQLQSNIAAGMYYLRLINQQTKKQYTEKLIVQ